MSRLLEAIVELLVANSIASLLTGCSAAFQLYAAARSTEAVVEHARRVTVGVAICASIATASLRVYEPVGALTPAPQIGVYVYLLVYSLGPVLVAGFAFVLDGLVRLVRSPAAKS